MMLAGGGGPSVRRLRAFGRTVELDLEDPAVLELISQRLPAFPPAPPGAKPHVRYVVSGRGESLRLAINGRRRSAERDRLGTANRIVSHLQLDLARHARGLAFVHAGVVRVGGVGILIPGRSFSGKSTLVQAFCAAGAAYASDEFAVIDGRGRVRPFARPLALRRSGGWVERIDPGMLPGGVVRRACRVAMVLLPRYRPGAAWRPSELSPARCLLELLRHALAVRARPDVVVTNLRFVAGTAWTLAGFRGDAGSLVAEIGALLRRASRLRSSRRPSADQILQG